MLKKVLIAAIAVAVSIGISGCGSSEEAKKAKENIAAGNAKIGQMNEISKSLSKDQVFVVPVRGYEKEVYKISLSSLEKMSDSKLASTIEKLVKYARLSKEALAHGSVKRVEMGDKETITNANQLAKKLALEGRAIQQERARKKK